ncbi:MAG: FAD-binding oxidoreductase, partial [Burkholderiaceae bacterium]|nr:FAD-binding oxidoreductase [Burkholderiaceae bacterium]
MPALPSHAHYVVIGAGIHGLSTSMHLAQKLKAKGKAIGAVGTRIVVLEKTGIGAGPSGIACGVVRNNYFQPAMRELMAHSVSVWESDPEAYSYHPVGYMQISPEVMHAQVGMIYEQQKAIGYESVFVEGEAESMQYMKGLFQDWQARNITSVLHEKRGGYANNMASLRGLAKKAKALGVEIFEGIEVKALRSGNGTSAITSVETTAGSIKCDQLIIGAGPWINSLWNMLGLPKQISVKGRDGT